jgi:NADH:ubiquinone oxidoreductase subunit K
VLFSILFDLVGNFLNGGLEVLTCTLTLAKHVLVLLKIALEVNINSKLLIETNKKVFEVLLLDAAVLEVHVEVGILSLLHHVGRETVDLDLAGGYDGLAARA